MMLNMKISIADVKLLIHESQLWVKSGSF